MTANLIGQAFVRIRPKTDGFEGEARSGLQGQLGKIAATIGGAFAAKKVFDFGAASFRAFGQAEESSLRFNKALDMNGRVSAASRAALDQYANAMQRKTIFEDDAIRSGVAQLAQYKLSGRQLQQLTPLLLDYAARTGTDLPTAAKKLGVAILGQGRALKQVGINFKDLKDPGKNFDQLVAGLTSKVKGFAVEQGKLGGSKVIEAKNQWNDLQEKIGRGLTPAVAKLAGMLADMLNWLGRNSALVKDVTLALSPLIAGLTAMLIAQKVAVAVKALNLAMKDNPALLVVAAVAALVAGLVIAYQKVGWFRAAVDGAFRAIGAVVTWFRDHWKLVLAAVLVPIAAIPIALYVARDRIRGVIDAVVGFFARLPGRIVGFVTGLGSTIWDAISGGMNALISNVAGKVATVVGFFSSLPRRAKDAFVASARFFVDIGKAILTKIGEGLSGAAGFAGRLAGAALDAVRGMVSGILNGIIGAINDMIPNQIGKVEVLGRTIFPGLDLPDNPIPMVRLARGGVIDRPVRALIGEDPRTTPEIVTPLATMIDTFRQVLREDGAGRVPIVVNVNAGMLGSVADAARAVGGELSWQLARHGLR